MKRLDVVRTVREAFAFLPDGLVRALPESALFLAALQGLHLLESEARRRMLAAVMPPQGGDIPPAFLMLRGFDLLELVLWCVWAALVLHRVLRPSAGRPMSVSHLLLSRLAFWFVFLLVAIMAFVLVAVVTGGIMVATGAGRIETLAEAAAGRSLPEAIALFGRDPAGVTILIIAAAYLVFLGLFWLRFSVGIAGAVAESRIVALEGGTWTKRNTLRLALAALPALVLPAIVLNALFFQVFAPGVGREDVFGTSSLAAQLLMLRGLGDAFGLIQSCLLLGYSLSVWRQFGPRAVAAGEAFG